MIVRSYGCLYEHLTRTRRKYVILLGGIMYILYNNYST